MAKIRDKVLEIAKLASECPENLQVVCFELLLKHHLESTSPRPVKREEERSQQEEKKEGSSEKEKPTDS